MSNESIDRLLKTPEGIFAIKKIKDTFSMAHDFTNKKTKDFTENLNEPLKGDLVNYLNTPKMADSFNQIIFKFLVSVSVDMDADNELIKNTLYSAYLGNIHILITDHIIDNKFDEDRRLVDQIPLSEVCYLEFILSFLETSDNDPVYIKKIREFYYKTFEIMYWEEKYHVGVISEYTDSDLYLVSQKCAPIKAVIYPLIKHKNNPSMEQNLYQVIDHLSLSSLLMDDYHDWEEDLRRQRYTYPLTLALKRLGIDNAEQIDVNDEKFIDQIKAAIFMSEVSLKVFDVILGRIRSAYEIAKDMLPISSLLMQMQLDMVEQEIKNIIKMQSSALNK